MAEGQELDAHHDVERQLIVRDARKPAWQTQAATVMTGGATAASDRFRHRHTQRVSGRPAGCAPGDNGRQHTGDGGPVGGGRFDARVRILHEPGLCNRLRGMSARALPPQATARG